MLLIFGCLDFGFLEFWDFGLFVVGSFVFYTCVSNLYTQLQNWIRKKNGVCIGIYSVFKGCACRRRVTIYIYIHIYVCVYTYEDMHMYTYTNGPYEHPGYFKGSSKGLSI